ncbi:MAG TPA: hypothetical protein VM286_03330 [Candidatus Thermoplasmatota archaeon]|nr:hypothetical protein [Candidatus Thermoplasmatota archaeon]
MRNRTLLLLLVLVALAIAFGVGQTLKWFVLSILALTLAIVLAVFFLVWLAKRRMRRSLGHLRTAMEQHAAATRRADRPHVIDVDAREDHDPAHRR